ncbi:hypothetical protein [Streptomyces nigra]
MGARCRTAEVTGHVRGMGRLIIDNDGRSLRVYRPGDRRLTT